MEQNPGPGANARKNLKDILNHALEEEVALSATTRDFLRRVTGPNSHSLFRLFGDQCQQVDQWLREIAERARAFGLAGRATAAELVRAGRATVNAPAGLAPRNMIGELLSQHEAIAAHLRRDLDACPRVPAIEDLLTRLAEFHETAAWMLRMLLDGPEVPRGER